MSTEFFNDQWRIPSNENQNKVSNYSMEFDGTNDYIDAGTGLGNSLGTYTGDASISLWFKADTTASNDGLFSITAFDDVVFGNLRININSNILYFVSSGTGSYKYISFTDTTSWHHLVCVFKSGDITNSKIYLDGVDQTTTDVGTFPSSLSLTGLKTIIGAYHSVNQVFQGKMDQVSIFDYALSQDQVTQLGAEGYAFNFNGSTQAIDCGAGSRFDIDQITVSGWVKRKSSISNYAVVAGVRNTNNGSTPYTINLSTASSKLIKFIVTQSNSTSVIVTSNTLIENDIWYHVVGVADGSNVKLYVNGELQTDQKTYDGTIISPTQNFNIGRQPSNPLYYWDGELSNISVFNTGLTGPQVTTLYNSGKPLADISSLNPLGWWKLDDSELFNSVSTKWSIDNNKYPSTYKSSLNFIGSGQYLQVPDSNDLSFGNGTTDSPFSISAWINPDAVEAAGIVAKYVTGGWEWLFYVEASNFLRLLLLSNNSAGDSITLTTDIAIPINTWTHVSATYNANEQADGISLYINGSLQTDVTERYLGTYQAMRNTTAPVQIGTWAGTFRPINGQMSNVSIWDAELTETQVSEIYNNGTPSNLLNHSATSNLISWWELNNTTIGIQDSKGSNNASNIGTTKYEGFVNVLAGDSVGMNASNLVASNINGELIANPMITSPKPIAYYQLGDQSVDNGANYLVPNNSLSDYVFDFDGTDDSIDLGDSDTFSFGNGTTDSPFSISAWINMTSNASVFRIVNKYDTNYEYQFDVLSGVLRFFVLNDPFTGYRGRTGSTLNTGQWYHVVATYSGVGGSAAQNGMELYVNGQNVVSSASTFGSYTAMSNTTAPVYIGRVATTYSNGKISNAAIFNTELSSTQVETLYNNGAPNDISSLNPTAWYKLNASEIFNSTSTEWSVDNNAYPSVYKSSLYFDGNDYIDLSVSSSSSVPSEASSWTFSAWLYLDSTHTSFPTIFERGAAYPGNGLHIRESAGIIQAYSGATLVQFNTLTLTADKWNYFSLTWEKTTNVITCYINDSSQSTTQPAGFAVTGTLFNIGKRQNNTGFWKGQMSNVAIFNTALSSVQVTTIYNNGQPQAAISHSPVSWWKLDNTTTGIQDSAGSNDGTNNGATEYAGFVNGLAGESLNMDSSNLVVSDLQQTSGYSPYALSLDGTDDFLNAGSASYLNGLSEFSISVWINLPTAADSKYIVSDWNYNTSPFGHFVLGTRIVAGSYYGLNLFIKQPSDAGQNSAQIGTLLLENTWHNAIFSYNSGTVTCYLNGLPVAVTVNGTLPTTLTSQDGNLNIGKFGGTITGFFPGKLSNIALWSVALTQANATEIYNQGVPGDISSLSPLVWWQLGSNSSFNTNWTCLNEGSVTGSNAVSAGGMTNNDIVDGPGYSASGLGTSTIDIVGDAPYSTANGLSENMDVLDRTTDVAPS